MPKRIALFIIGFVLAIGGFLIYQHFNGFTPGGRGRGSADGNTTGPALPPSYEKRNPETGQLEYLVSGDSIEQLKDNQHRPLPGQFILHRPVATFYSRNGRTIEIRADICKAIVDQQSGSSMSGTINGGGANPMLGGLGGSKGGAEVLPIRIGLLSGHVRVTMSNPPGSAPPTTSRAGSLMRGDLKIYFDDDVEYDRDVDILKSAGNIHIRSDSISFDGQGLQLALNRDTHPPQIEYLRIDKGDEIIVRGVGADALDMMNPSATQPTSQPSIAKNHSAETKAGASTRVAAATKPAPLPEDAPPTYKLAFGQNVRVSVGENVLTSTRLYLLFMLTGDMGNNDETPANQGAEHAEPIKPSPTSPATAAGTMLATEDIPGPMPKADAKNDLVIHWTGPMEMRPAGPEEVKIADGKDIALQAVGTVDTPVILQGSRESKFTVMAGVLWFHRFEHEGETLISNRIRLEPGDYKRVELEEPSRGKVINQGDVSIYEREQKQFALLEGPGTLTYVPPAATRPSTRPEASQVAAAPTRIDWSRRMELDLINAPVDDKKNPDKKGNLTIRRARISGVGIHNDTFELTGDMLDVLLANNPNSAQPALEHLLVTGNVVVNSLRRNKMTLHPGDPADGMHAPRLEVFTAAPDAKSAPVPTQLVADGGPGEVAAWRYKENPATGPAGRANAGLDKDMITTAHLIADLKPRDKNTTDDTGMLGGIGQSFDPSHILATGGVQIDLAPAPGSGRKGILAQADTLDADPSPGSSKAILSAAKDQPNAMVHIRQGGNIVEGHIVNLVSRKGVEEGLEIPGGGSFLVILPADKKNGRDQPTPMQVTWDKHMSYDNIKKLAVFEGRTLAQMVDENPDLGRLFCDNRLKIQLMENAAVAAASKPAAGTDALFDTGALKLDTIDADGHVEACGTKVGPDKSPLIRMVLDADHLTYHDAGSVFDVPGPGAMYIDNLRPDTSKEHKAGKYVFNWGGKLVYDGLAHNIEFTSAKKDDVPVDFFFLPAKPIQLVSESQLGGGKSTTEAVTQIHLTTSHIVATLTGQKDDGKPVANPLGIGASGKMEISNVLADGGAELEAGESKKAGDFKMAGASLSYDATSNIAVVNGSPDNKATFIQPGQGIIFARKVLWDMTKDHEAFTVEGGSGNIDGQQRN